MKYHCDELILNFVTHATFRPSDCSPYNEPGQLPSLQEWTRLVRQTFGQSIKTVRTTAQRWLLRVTE